MPHPVPNAADRIKLMKILSDHGFHHAATGFHEWIDFRRAIITWEKYPDCMAQFPTHTSKKSKNIYDGHSKTKNG